MQITTSILVSYAHGLLAPGISQQVKEALLADETLRWQYEGILQLMKDYPDDDPEEVLEKMSVNVSNKIKAIPRKQQAKQSVSVRRWLLLAAVFILVIGSSVYFFIRNQNSAAALAQQILDEEAATPFANATRGLSSVTDTAKWKTAFAKEDFQSVISTLKIKQDKSPEEEFFLALSYLKLSPAQPEKAEPILDELTQQQSAFTSDAWLYLGLAQTLLNKKEVATTSLHHVEQTAQVKELEERLRK